MLRNSRFNNCQDIASYRKDMSNLITTATQQLNLKNVEVGQLLSDLFMILVNHKVKLEANFASVIIAIMVLEGIGRSLDPELDILSAAKPFLFKKTVKSLFKNQ
jgi:aarF domain-containing kinase